MRSKSKFNKFEHVAGMHKGGVTFCLQNDRQTDTTENITSATPFAGGNYIAIAILCRFAEYKTITFTCCDPNGLSTLGTFAQHLFHNKTWQS